MQMVAESKFYALIVAATSAMCLKESVILKKIHVTASIPCRCDFAKVIDWVPKG